MALLGIIEEIITDRLGSSYG